MWPDNEIKGNSRKISDLSRQLTALVVYVLTDEQFAKLYNADGVTDEDLELRVRTVSGDDSVVLVDDSLCCFVEKQSAMGHTFSDNEPLSGAALDYVKKLRELGANIGL